MDGAYMIELIMAIAASSMLAAALVASLADTQRFSVAGQNQIIAVALAHQQIDNARNSLYASLIPGTYQLLVNRTLPGQTGVLGINPRPLLADLVNLNFSYQDPTQPSQMKNYTNLFPGTVSETIVENTGSLAKTKTVTVTVRWQEGTTNASVWKQYSVSTLIAEYGLHTY